ncbi:hypothetical protein R0L47_07320 [Pectobacterium polonicum]|uniref:Uncharacterized protein n=1 Tax=Pectobacterium polonicum TaxID=2485124 RepID=A0AAE9NK45_9GAMM|nr:hypothetical protein [Pectobacterium polonicum]MDC9817941.1 hypothetical protein [Pectobacterium polonicum]TKY83814.1 hypothetical protein EDI29_03605 [Pectobacterium polonicum]UVO06509.1 hypothetical protein LW347_11215 [Pectobacterium polonicum]
MDKTVKVLIIRNGMRDNAEFSLSQHPACSIRFSIDGNFIYTAESDDFFSCFCALRRKFRNVTFLCKGAKRNVYPSRMARQMAYGIKGYEFEIGRPAVRGDLVSIFDYEEADLVSPEEQERHFQEWLSSFL